MAFRRTFQRLAQRNDIAPQLSKLWKKHYPVDGQVTQVLSPLEQKIVSPLFKDLASNLAHRIVGFVTEAGPGLLAGYAVYAWCNKEHERLLVATRS